MGSSQNCVCCHRSIRHLIVSLLFLLVSSLTQVRFMAEGTVLPKLVATAQKGTEEEKVVIKSMIGSRPPKCERRCSSCRQCEAVQIPVTTQSLGHKRSNFFAVTYSRGDDISNYKPMSWKCKCGNMFFNP